MGSFVGSSVGSGEDIVYQLHITVGLMLSPRPIKSPPPFFRSESDEVICQKMGILFNMPVRSKSLPFLPLIFAQGVGDLV